jgi:hypothetical protein
MDMMLADQDHFANAKIAFYAQEGFQEKAGESEAWQHLAPHREEPSQSKNCD